MKRVVAVQHVAFEDLGSFEPRLREHGYEVRYVDATTRELQELDPTEAELLVVLGGPIGVYEEHAYPFLRTELALLEPRLRAGLPVLGLCLGCQLLARSLGARVYPGSGKEIGWAPLQLTEAGRTSPARHLAGDEGPVLHWHGDTFDMPEGAVRLASTERYPNQAFQWGGGTVLALQFHPEVTAAGLERWFVGHAAEIAAEPGLSVPALRADTAQWAPHLEPRGRRLLDEWLAGLG
jgi:GMP synthase (glutamine-hydrolysing)